MLKTKNKPPRTHTSYINDQCVSIQHEDNFQLLNLLIPEKLFNECRYKSSIPNKPKLFLTVLNKYKYTTELVFKYSFDFGNSEEIVVKLYHDAQVAEVVYCTDMQQFIRLLGPKICPKIHKETRGSLNTFLNKWLCFLLQNNYNKTNWYLTEKE